MISEAIQLAVLLLFIATVGIVGDWRRTREQLDASCDDAERNYDPTVERDREPPSV